MCATFDTAPDMNGKGDEEEMQSKLSHRREKWGRRGRGALVGKEGQTYGEMGRIVDMRRFTLFRCSAN